MPEVKIWELASVISVLTAVLGFMIKMLTIEVIKRLDDIVHELKQLTRTTTIQEQQIKNLQDQDTGIHQRLEEHSARILALENKIHS